MTSAPVRANVSARSLITPLALAQFICSYAATNMNVAIDAIASSLHTTVLGLQTTITLFTLTMASLMIPGSKLTDIWGRKRCFMAGLIVYGVGAILALLAQSLGLMIFGYSLLEGAGSALLIPPVYILVTASFPDVKSRAKYFGVISGAGGLGAAAGPLIGGLITTTISWRASFGLQVLVVAAIIVMARRIPDQPVPQPVPRFDLTGAVLSAAGLFFVVLGILQSSKYGWFASRENFVVGGTVVIAKGGVSPVWLFVGFGVVILALFFVHIRRADRKGKEPLLRPKLFRNRTSNLGLGTQLVQWLVLQGSFFVVSVYLQKHRHYNAIETGLMLTPATIGILLASARAATFAKRHAQRSLIIAGFVTTSIGMALLLALVPHFSGVLIFVPGLLLFGAGTGIMLTSSVNVVQSSFPDAEQGDISGLSRSFSNLGSSLGTALAGSILVAASVPGRKPFGLSFTLLLVISLIGLVLAVFLPRKPATADGAAGATDAATSGGTGAAASAASAQDRALRQRRRLRHGPGGRSPAPREARKTR